MNQAAPPGPMGRWGGNNHLRAIRADFREFSHALHQEHGDVVSYRVLGQSVFQFASPDLAHEVLVEKAKSLCKPDNQKRALGPIIGRNLFTSDGPAWVTRRRLLAPVFLPQVIERYRSIVVRQARSELDRLSNGEANVSRIANTIALLSVAESLFGTAVNDVADEFLDVAARLQGAVTRQILSPFLLPLWIPTADNRTVRSSLRFFHSLISPLIDQRRKSPGQHLDLLAALLTATDQEGKAHLNDREARDEALTMLLAGSDTTAAALSWSAFLLARHPETQHRLREEVVAAGDESIPRLAEQVFLEAMRLYPPAIAIARQAAQPVEIGGIPIPRGALVFVSVYSIHHDSRWFPQPEEFQPQRFAPEHAEAMPENAFLPFGIGPRACIGRRFAMMEGPLVLAELVRQFDVQLTKPDQTPELETQLSLHPRHGLRLRLTRH
ncbi:cytochrome P450 [Lignipirellula cremea]|nr:cytochrome P450 [Lignipirellula cremea]